MKAFFFLFHSFNLLFFIAPVVLLFTSSLLTVLALLAVKFCLDFLLLLKGASLLNERRYVFRLVPLELCYALYNVFVGPLGLMTSFQWKPDPAPASK